MSRRDPVVVIGAGAAGLAAARELARAGVPIVILEARSRLFGRVYTVHDSGWPMPVDAGAEFIHDHAPMSVALARRGRLALEVVPERRRRIERGSRHAPFADPDDLLKRYLKDSDRGSDRSLAAVLSDQRAIAPYELETVRAYVQGFHAADLERISARALRTLANASGDDTWLQRRPAGGYASLLHTLVDELAGEGAIFHTRSAVTRVRWRGGRVRIECGHRLRLQARAAVITVPISLLKTDAIVFDPMPPAWPGSFSRLEMGAARKISLLFGRPFWDDGATAPRAAGRPGAPPNFWHAPHEAFPTWWTSAPQTSPVLTAWAGGPAARALAACSARLLAEQALASLARITGVRRSRIDRLFVDAITHDWTADPWTRGAYAYVGVGGLTAQRRLAEPVDATLVLAGEALDREHIGTVEGALTSGRRAARRLLRGWSR
jgi:monoamine oxidase